MWPVLLGVLLSGEIRLGNSIPAPAAYEQRYVAVASSGEEMLAVWVDQRMGQQPFAPPVLFATRISSSGEILDPYGIRLSSQPAYEPPPVAAWGGDAYLVIGCDGSAFHAQKVGKNGRPLHEPERIISNEYLQYAEAIHLASNGNGYLFVWRNTESTFASWLDRSGRVTRTTPLHMPYSLSSSLVVHRGDYYYFHSQLESVNQGALRAAYLTTLRDDGAIDKQRIAEPTVWNVSVAAASNGEEILLILSDPHGHRSFSIRDAREPFTPRPFGGGLGSSMNTRVAWDGSSFLVYWTKNTNHYTVTDVVGMRVDRDGRAIDPAPVVLPQDASLFEAAAFARAGSTCALVWPDDRFSEGSDVAGIVFDGFDDLFARRGEARLISKSARPQENVGFATDGTAVLAVWAESGKPSTINGAFVRAGRDPGLPFVIASADEKEILDVAVAYGSGVYVVVWEVPSAGWTRRVMAARVSASGETLDPAPRQVGVSQLGQDDLTLTSDGTGFIATWRTGVYTLGVTHIDAALDAKSIPIEMPRGLQPQPNTPPPDPSIHRNTPRVVFDGTDFVVAWTESRYVDPFSHLRVLRISRDGTLRSETTMQTPASALVARGSEIIALSVYCDWTTRVNCISAIPLGSTRGTTIACIPPDQTISWISAIPSGDGYAAIWMTHKAGQYDVHGARFTLDGEVEVLEVATTVENERRPSLIRQGSSVLFGYERIAADDGFVPRAVFRRTATRIDRRASEIR